MAILLWYSNKEIQIQNAKIFIESNLFVGGINRMHKVTFYPLGNADCCKIDLKNGRKILFDYAQTRSSEDETDPRIDLAKTLREDLENENRKNFDVVAFTHADKDHICGFSDFFYLEHAAKYQDNKRIKIETLWVPAAIILEEGLRNEARILRSEARHRLIKGKGIRVFSKPEKLKDWLEENSITLDSRRHLITDAGQIVPGFALAKDGVEFFCHSPFIKHVDEGEDMRNAAALIFNVRFKVDTSTFDFLAVGDSQWDVMEDIVQITKNHGNDDRLEWDLYNIPHHCSYLALSDDKGKTETTPKPLIEDLLLSGKEGAYIVSSSDPIEDSEEGRKQELPPHIQAKKCYERFLKRIEGAKFLVTMEEPNKDKPEPLIFKIESEGITIGNKVIASGISIISSKPAPRVGRAG